MNPSSDRSLQSGFVLTNITDLHPNDANRIVDVKYRGSDQAFYTVHVAGEPGKWSVILNTTLDYDQVRLLALRKTSLLENIFCRKGIETIEIKFQTMISK